MVAILSFVNELFPRKNLLWVLQDVVAAMNGLDCGMWFVLDVGQTHYEKREREERERKERGIEKNKEKTEIVG